jgi:cytochrome b-561
MKTIHAVLHATVFVFVIVALKAVFDSHNHNIDDKTGQLAPIPNLYTLHSWCGITVVSLFGLQVSEQIVIVLFEPK